MTELILNLQTCAAALSLALFIASLLMHPFRGLIVISDEIAERRRNGHRQ